MEAVNLLNIDLNNLSSLPYDSIEDKSTTKHRNKFFSNLASLSLTVKCDNNILSKLGGKLTDKYNITLPVFVQKRKHKKKRINKKWAKRYGYKCVTKTIKGWKLKQYKDGSFEFISKEYENENN